MAMNIYRLINPKAQSGSAIRMMVVAENFNDATRLFHPSMDDGATMFLGPESTWTIRYENGTVPDTETWCKPHEVECELIGTSVEETFRTKQILCVEY